MKQKILAAFFTALLIGLLEYFTKMSGSALLASSFGSTACIIFGLPDSKAAKPKTILFAYTVCSVMGFLALLIHFAPVSVSLGMALGIAVFMMLQFDRVHPPAAGIPILIIQGQETYSYLVFPIAIGLGVLFITQLIFNKLAKTS